MMDKYIELNVGLVVVRMKRELFCKMLSSALDEVEIKKKKQRKPRPRQHKEKER